MNITKTNVKSAFVMKDFLKIFKTLHAFLSIFFFLTSSSFSQSKKKIASDKQFKALSNNFQRKLYRIEFINCRLLIKTKI